MSLTITIGGVDVSSKLARNSFALTNAIGQRDTLALSTAAKDTYSPAMGAPIVVSHSELGLQFGGSIRRMRNSRIGAATRAAVQCASWEQIFDRRRVGEQKTFTDTPAGEVFQYIFDTWLTFEGLTASIVATGPNITVSFDWCSVREAFDLIAQQASSTGSAFLWDCTAGKVTRLYEQTSFPAPIDVTESRSDIFRDIQVERSFDGYANKVFNRLGRYISEERDNTYSPDGTETSFTFELPLAKVPAVTVGGVAQTVGIRDVETGKQFYWQDGSADVTPDASLSLAGTTVVITGQGYQSTVIDCGQNDDEVAERSTIEGNSGWYIDLIESSALGTSAEAIAAGTAHLAKVSRIPYTVDYATTYGGIRAGMYQRIALTSYGPAFDATFVVESSTLVQENGHWFWRIRAVNGALANNWLTRLRQMVTGTSTVTSGGGGTVVTPGAITTPPANPTITLVEADAQPTTGSNARGTRNSAAKRGVTIRYTAPDPIGTFLGVYAQIEAPDQSATDTRPLDGSVALDGSRSLGGPKDPISFGPFAYAETGGSLRVQIPEPDADLLPMGCRARLIPYSDTVTNDAATAPTATFGVPDPTASKPNSGTAYAPNPQSVLIPATVPGSGVRGAAQTNPYRVTTSGVDETHLWVTVVVDPQAAGYVLQVFSPDGELINATGIETAKHFELVFNTPAAVGTYTVYALGSDGTNINPLVEGITPYATVTLGTAGGTLNLGQSTPASMGLGLGADGKTLSVKIAGPLYGDVAGNIDLRIASDFVVSTVGGVSTLTQNVVDLAKAANFDTGQFDKTSGTMVIKALAVNKLIAGDALFAGDASFARTGGGKVTINSAGVAIADNLTIPTATVTATSTGVTVAKGSNNVQVNASGVAINGPSGTLTATSSGVVIANGTSSVTVSATAVTIVNGALSSPTITGGSLTISGGGVVVNVDSSNYVTVTNVGSSRKTIHHWSYFRVETQADAFKYASMTLSGFEVFGNSGTTSASVSPGGFFINGDRVMGARLVTRPVTLADVINAGVTHGWWV